MLHYATISDKIQLSQAKYLAIVYVAKKIERPQEGNKTWLPEDPTAKRNFNCKINAQKSHLWQLSVRTFKSCYCLLNENMDQTLLGWSGEIKITELVCVIIHSLPGEGKSDHRKLLLLAKHFNQRQPDVTFLRTRRLLVSLEGIIHRPPHPHSSANIVIAGRPTFNEGSAVKYLPTEVRRIAKLVLVEVYVLTSQTSSF